MQSDNTLRFLATENIKRLHDHSIKRHGGSFGIRGEGLLESAVSMPSQTFGGVYLHATLGAKAVAYFFHLCQNHAFIDGNKRIALLACEVFLLLNGRELSLSSKEAEDMVMRVAEGVLSKEDLTALVEKSIQLKRK